jgi:site-specific recombinase XerD
LVGEFVRIYRRGRIWYANFQNKGKQYRITLGTTNKKVALRKALKIDAELAAGRWKEAINVATLGDGIKAYLTHLETESRSAKTLTKYRYVLGQVAALASARGCRDLSAIDLGFVDAYRKLRTDLQKGKKTIYGECVILRQLVNFALSRKMLAEDPLAGLKLKKPKPTPQPCWTWDECERILVASPEAIRPALTLLAETGMRYGEMAWLTWDDVDLVGKILHVREKEGWRPKSGDARAIPLSSRLNALLESLPRSGRWVVSMPSTVHHPGRNRQWTERQLLVELKRVLKKLNLPGKLHTFRHTFISHALVSGTAIPLVKKWVGHVDPRVIELYTHVHDHASQAAMQRLTGASSSLQPKEN